MISLIVCSWNLSRSRKEAASSELSSSVLSSLKCLSREVEGDWQRRRGRRRRKVNNTFHYSRTSRCVCTCVCVCVCACVCVCVCVCVCLPLIVGFSVGTSSCLSVDCRVTLTATSLLVIAVEGTSLLSFGGSSSEGCSEEGERRDGRITLANTISNTNQHH